MKSISSKEIRMFFSDISLGEYGFLLPEREIIPTGTETLAGEIALLQYIEGQIYA